MMLRRRRRRVWCCVACVRLRVAFASRRVCVVTRAMLVLVASKLRRPSFLFAVK